MTTQTGPTNEQFSAFVDKVQAFRKTLGQGDQELLDAMYYAAMGTHEKDDEEVKAYWVAVGPRGGVAWGPGRPWARAYNRYYPTPYYG